MANTMVVARTWVLRHDWIEKLTCDGLNQYSYTLETSALITFTLGEDFKVASHDLPLSLIPILKDVGVCPGSGLVSVEVTPGQGIQMYSIGGGYKKGYLKETEPEFFELFGEDFINTSFTLEPGVGQLYLRLELENQPPDTPRIVVFKDDGSVEIVQELFSWPKGLTTLIRPVKEFVPDRAVACEDNPTVCLIETLTAP